MSDTWSLDNPLFATFAFNSTVLAVKMALMAPTIGYLRITRGVHVNPEDSKLFRGPKEPKTDSTVERVRRAHQNDVENIPLFFLVAPMYLHTNPSSTLATALIRVFTVGRILHTIFYLKGSSLRPLTFLVTEVTLFYMAGSVLRHLW